MADCVPVTCTDMTRLPRSEIMNIRSQRTGISPTTTLIDTSKHNELALCILKSTAWDTISQMLAISGCHEHITWENTELKKVSHINFFISGLLRTSNILLMCMVNFQEGGLLALGKCI